MLLSQLGVNACRQTKAYMSPWWWLVLAIMCYYYYVHAAIILKRQPLQQTLTKWWIIGVGENQSQKSFKV